MPFTARRIANSWLDGANAGSVKGAMGSGGVVSAEAADGPTKQTNSTAATTLRMRRFSVIRAISGGGYSPFQITPSVSNQKICVFSG
jgi:hypothetical protein